MATERLQRTRARETFDRGIWKSKRHFSPHPGRTSQNIMCSRCSPLVRAHPCGSHPQLCDGRCRCALQASKGFNVLHPFGWDAFGLPAENAAMQQHQSGRPTKISRSCGPWAFDWSREFATCDPEYYHQQQRLFLAFSKPASSPQKEQGELGPSGPYRACQRASHRWPRLAFRGHRRAQRARAMVLQDHPLRRGTAGGPRHA